MAERRAIFMASPFHRFGVKIKTKGETKRDRRITPDEERRLLEAADKLNCAEHAFAGAQMRDRIVGALETACRLGEMLKIQNRHVLWDTHQIIIPAEHAKDAESRRIPFEPKGRLAQLLKRRRFLGPKAFVFGGADRASTKARSARRGNHSCCWPTASSRREPGRADA